MKTTLDLPDDLLREVGLRASRQGQELTEAVADLLRKGLAAGAAGLPTEVQADEATLKRRAEIAQKFISGEWGAELGGYEAGRAAERQSAREWAERWRA